MTELAQRLRSGALWSYAQSAGLALLNFGGGVILARLLEPSDFGVFIAVSAFTAILIIQIKFGLPEAVIQADRITPAQLSRCFWVMEGIALVAAVLFLLAAPWLQQLYGDARFRGVALVMTLTFFIVPYVAVGSALLKRELRFRVLARVRISASLLSLGIMLALAFAGAGPLSLAVGGVSAAAITALLLAQHGHVRVELLPRGEIRSLLGYAWKTNLMLVQETAAERIDNMLVGGILGTAALGWYNRGFSLARLPVEQFAESFRDLMFSGLSRVKDDAGSTHRLQYVLLCAVSSATFFFLLLFWFIAEDFVGVVYGEKWLPAVTPMRIMIVGSFATTVALTLYSLCAAGNLVGRLAKLGAVQLGLTLVIVAAAAPAGLAAVAAGIALRDLAMLTLLQRLASRSHLTIRWHGILHALAPALLATGAGAAAGLLLLWHASADHAVAGVERALMVGSGVGLAYGVTLLLLAALWTTHEPLAATRRFTLGIAGRLLGRNHAGTPRP